MLLLLSGPPGAGKTEFCRWLAREHGYEHIETDRVWSEWGPFLTGLDLATAVAVRNKMRGIRSDVILEWGFLPIFAHRVSQLATVGIDPWWFQADDDLAFQQYLQRDGPVLPDNYRVQLQQIKANWSVIERVFAGRTLNVLAADGTRLPYNEIFDLMCA